MAVKTLDELKNLYGARKSEVESSGLKSERDNLLNQDMSYEMGDEYIGITDKIDDLSGELETTEQFKGTYEDRINSAVSDYLGRDKFNFNPDNSSTYQQLRDTYLTDGKTAMQDTLASGAMLSNGYNNSAAQVAAQQVYQDYAKDVTDVIPELEAEAYERYQDEGDAMLNEIELMQGVDDTEYGRHRDEIGDKKDLLSSYIDMQNIAATVDASKNAYNKDIYDTKLSGVLDSVSQEHTEKMDNLNYNLDAEDIRHDNSVQDDELEIYRGDIEHDNNLDDRAQDETERSNKEGERLSWAEIEEVIRSNKEGEEISWADIDETIRSNKVAEGLNRDELNETIRSNKVNEGIDQTYAENDTLSTQDEVTYNKAKLAIEVASQGVYIELTPELEIYGFTQEMLDAITESALNSSVSSGGGSGSSGTYSSDNELSDMEENGDYYGIWSYCSENSESLQETIDKCAEYGLSETAVRYLNGYDGESRKITSIDMAKELIKNYGTKDYTDSEINSIVSGAYTEDEFEHSFLANYNSQYDNYADYLTAAFSKHIDL